MIKFEHYNGLLLKFQWEIEKLIHEGELPHLKVKIVCACAIFKQFAILPMHVYTLPTCATEVF